MNENLNRRNCIIASVYFIVATVLTYWFIESASVYSTFGQKIISCSIAGFKWVIQIVFALYFLQEKKWVFIKNISFTCLIGSLVLIPFCVNSLIGKNADSVFFVSSLILSVVVMVVSYFISVKRAGVQTRWWAGWLFCLAIAIITQLKLVFNIWIF